MHWYFIKKYKNNEEDGAKMDDLGLKDNNNILKLMVEEMNKRTELFNYISSQSRLNFNSEDFDSSDDKIKYLGNLCWKNVWLDDMIFINKFINFDYIFLDTADRNLCYVKNGDIKEFGLDYSVSGQQLEYEEYKRFQEYLMNTSQETYKSYIDYTNNITNNSDGSYERMTKCVKDYFNQIENKFDITIWTDVE